MRTGRGPSFLTSGAQGDALVACAEVDLVTSHLCFLVLQCYSLPRAPQGHAAGQQWWEVKLRYPDLYAPESFLTSSACLPPLLTLQKRPVWAFPLKAPRRQSAPPFSLSLSTSLCPPLRPILPLSVLHCSPKP